MAKDSWDLGPLRASIDPFGWYRSWEEMLTGMAPLAGLGGENAPGVVESWKQFGKASSIGMSGRPTLMRR